jgi:hypothetical protein
MQLSTKLLHTISAVSGPKDTSNSFVKSLTCSRQALANFATGVMEKGSNVG